MKILVIGDSCNGWNKNVMEHMLDRSSEYQIDFLCLGKVSEEWEQYYNNLNIKVISLPEKLRKLREKNGKTLCEKMRVAGMGILFFSKHQEYDIINYHFVSGKVLVLLCGIKKTRKKLILSYWGSDLLRQKKSDEWIEKIFIKYKGMAYATFDNMDLEEVFFSKYSFDKNKSQVAYIGDPILDAIKKQQGDKDSWWMIDGNPIPRNRVIIAVGYNGGSFQQHLKVIEQMAGLDEKYKQNIFLILQMTYGGTEEYIESCSEACGTAELNFLIFKEFLDESEVAKIRLVTDLFINSQTTDAFAGSVCEYMYTGTMILNAKWLHYKELDHYPFQYREYEAFDELPALIAESLDYLITREDPAKTGTAAEVIWELRSNERCRKKWMEIIEKIGRNNE